MRPLGETKILVIDGSVRVRSELCAELGARGWTVMADPAASDLATVLRVFQPDLIMAELGTEDPQRVVDRLRAARPVPVILSLPSNAEPRMRALAMRSGAEDTVSKPFDVDEVLARIEHALGRRGGYDRVLHIDDLVIDEAGHVVTRSESEVDLTVTEFNLLMAFVRHAGHVMSKRQLLSTVWGFDDYDVNLVEVHVSALRRKLERHGPRLIQTVRGLGYVMRLNGRSSYHHRPALAQPSLF